MDKAVFHPDVETTLDRAVAAEIVGDNRKAEMFLKLAVKKEDALRDPA